MTKYCCNCKHIGLESEQCINCFDKKNWQASHKVTDMCNRVEDNEDGLCNDCHIRNVYGIKGM
jgi:hypothetical protein